MAPEESSEIKALRSEISAQRGELSAIREDVTAVRESVAAIQAKVESGFEEGHRRNYFVADGIDNMEKAMADQIKRCGENRLSCRTDIVGKISQVQIAADEKINKSRAETDASIAQLRTAVASLSLKVAIISGIGCGIFFSLINFAIQWLFKS